jgi:ribosomal protein L11 methylase PrmA
LNTVSQVPGSFRDPRGQVFECDGRILRTINASAFADYSFAKESGLLARWVAEGRFIDSREIDPPESFALAGDVRVVEHERIGCVSYPYEWSFGMLQAAALHHLDLQREALDSGISFSDATAYNVQFRGVQPVFIDLLSLQRYREGDFWLGYKQFCEQFLNPLLLRSTLGITHNAWFRGGLEGIGSADLARILPLRSKFSFKVLAHVLGPAKMQAVALSRRQKVTTTESRFTSRGLSRNGFVGILEQLRNWIAKLKPLDIGESTWGDYQDTHTYDDAESQAKRAFVAEFVAQVRPRTLGDFGCNSGAFSEIACQNGAESVVGFEYDPIALERAYQRAVANKLNFLPLYLDAANPSPAQGWAQRERPGLAQRMQFDAIMALAFEHHLAIGRNVPLNDVVAWLVGFAPRGIIEFVHKSDSTIQLMLAGREDIFPDYSQDAFEQALNKVARIEKAQQITKEGRMLYWYERPATADDAGIS